MSVFAISDLHLSFYKNKPMDIFGKIWENHPEKVKYNWGKYITEDDIILMPGDISWAKNMLEFAPDLEYLMSLCGKKIFLQGNHDYWWGSTAALNDLSDNMFFLKNTFFSVGNLAICGSRGWLCPNDTRFTEHDEKIYLREAARLKMSLEAAEQKGFSEFLVMMHFPPTNDKKEPSLFTETLRKFCVKNVVYGHLHGEKSFYSSYMGDIDGIYYRLISADFLNFCPVKIL